MKPNIPDAIVRGEIFTTEDTGLLVQDMLEVTLPTDTIIDVGWYPEHDPNGAYVIIVFHDDPNVLLQEPVITREPIEVLSAVVALAEKYSTTEPRQ